jgi:hypothetical protein
MEFNSKVCGIPCIIKADVFVCEPNWGDASDQDCYGYVEIDTWTVLDRKGRPAPWLERKLTDKEETRIEREIIRNA